MHAWSSAVESAGALHSQPEPEQLKAKLCLLLRSRDIPFKYNTTTKFANFINRTLD